MEGKLRNMHGPNRKNVKLMSDYTFKERQFYARLAEESYATNKELLQKGTQDRWKVINGKLKLIHGANPSVGNEN